MPYPSLLHPEPLSLWQSTADPYLHRRCSNRVLSQSLWGPWVLVYTTLLWTLLHLWQEWGLILTRIRLSYCLAGASPLPLDMGYLLISALPPTILLGFSDLGRGISLHGGPAKRSCRSWPWMWGCLLLAALRSSTTNAMVAQFKRNSPYRTLWS